MKKHILIVSLALIILVTCLFSLTACQSLSDEKAFAILREAYENSVGIKEGSDWGEIYYYQECVKQKAYLQGSDCIDGFQHDLSVNVNCEYNKDNSYNFDKNYYMSLTQTFNKETIDQTAKTTMTFVAENNVTTSRTNEKNKPSVQTLYASKTVGKETQKYYQPNVETKSITTSDWFYQYTLKSKLAILGDLTIIDITFVDTKDVKGGKAQTVMTTKLSFKIKDEYFKSHPQANVLDGNYVYLEIVDVNLSKNHNYRINNIIVYKTETIGGVDPLKIDYESYTLKISYMGPKITPINPQDKDKLTNDLFNNNFNANYLYKPE